MGQINYKKINQDIYKIDNNISRSNEMVFVAALVIAICSDPDNKKSDKLVNKIQFMTNENGTESQPVDQLIQIAKTYIGELSLPSATKQTVFSSLDSISGVNTGLNNKKPELKSFIIDFVDNVFPYIEPDDLFFEDLYKTIDKKASTSDRGIILTPVFIADFMLDLLDLDYKTDVVADLCSGTGLFSIHSYTKMLADLKSDKKNGKISDAEYETYQRRLTNAIIANDIDTKMVTVCLANFLLKSIDVKLLYNTDCITLEKSSFKLETNKNVHPTKAILNPPYEDDNKPLEIIYKNIELVKQDGSQGHKVVAILPAQKFGQNRSMFSKILNLSTLTCVVKTQEDLFKESGKAQPASIFVFDTTRGHKKDDIIRYYNFSDTGFVYLKDSGLVDKNSTFESKKVAILEKIKNPPSYEEMRNNLNLNNRTWQDFYEINSTDEIYSCINPDDVKINSEEADVTFENMILKKALKEKGELLDNFNNSFVDEDGQFEKYIIEVLSGEN